MPVWLTLLVSVLATVAFLGGLVALVVLFVQGKATKGRPQFGLFSTGGNGTLGAFVTWDPATFQVQIYRFRISVVSPAWSEKEATYTFTFDNPRKERFSVILQLPEPFVKLIESSNAKALISVEARSVEEFSLSKDFTLKSFRRLYRAAKHDMAKVPPVAEQGGVQDAPAVMSLDYSELVERRKKLKALEAAASAKAAKKPAAPAPAAKPAETTA
jgi:hypothetical protein